MRSDQINIGPPLGLITHVKRAVHSDTNTTQLEHARRVCPTNRDTTTRQAAARRPVTAIDAFRPALNSWFCASSARRQSCDRSIHPFAMSYQAGYPAPGQQQNYGGAPPPPPAAYVAPPGGGYQQQQQHETTSRGGDGFWKGCCAAICCCCLLDMCF
ncbi:hypothetical protein HU200_005007 [Digitaria exilis]|uniref:Cysteine-rich transmembrane domain-containing protein n=1 Tax=Digitaria exilis TaxID=1010633 RepID=A0A835FTN2_9POAL|nr:hypothetical protein HU200_005007 [Digitaria exilis]